MIAKTRHLLSFSLNIKQMYRLTAICVISAGSAIIED